MEIFDTLALNEKNLIFFFYRQHEIKQKNAKGH
jgi:hypothetical protein